MAFADNFTGADGQPLSARAGWSLAFGEEAIFVASNALTKGATNDPSTSKVYYRQDDGTTTQSIAFDQSPYTATNWPSNQPLLRPFALGSGATNATFNAYYLAIIYVNADSYTVQVQRYDNGTPTSPSASSTANLSSLNGIELRVAVTGGIPTLSIYQNGTQLTSFADNDANRKVSGRRGMLSRVGNAAGSGPIIDNYSDDGPAASIIGSASVTDAPDTMAATGGAQIRGASALTDTADMMSATAAVYLRAAAALTDDPDVMASAGQVRMVGNAAMTDAMDLIYGVGTVYLAGAAAITDAPDTMASTASVLPTGLRGELTDAPDTMASAATIRIQGATALTDDADVMASAGQARMMGAAALTDAADVMAGTFSTRIGISAAIVDAPDTIVASASVPMMGNTSLLDQADTMAAAFIVTTRAAAGRRVLWTGLPRRVTFG